MQINDDSLKTLTFSVQVYAEIIDYGFHLHSYFMLPLKSSEEDHSIYSSIEETLNTSTHGIGFVLAVCGIIALVDRSSAAIETVTALIYGCSLALLFLSSTLYHAAKDIQRKLILRKIDHTAIYLLIAGTYTPFMLLSVGGTTGKVALAVIWFVGISGIIFKLTIGHKYPKISVSTYAVMGWFALLLIYPIYQSLSATGFTLLVAGGLCYSAGIPFYMMKNRHYSHALWHVCVVAGAACHFFAIYWHVLKPSV